MTQPPKTYTVTVTVTNPDTGATLTSAMEGIKREDILSPSYQNPGVTALVEFMEYHTA